MRLADAPSILRLARTLGQWFNAEGLARMEVDLAIHGGYVALRGVALVGFVTWSALDAEIANLSWMGVAEEEHRRGIGIALLAALVEDLRRRGFRTLEVSTVADTVDYEPYAATRRFYRARGFADFAVDPNHYGRGDDRSDRLRLRLDLR
jgi:GNAT superfamily N-acetyltransferase